MTLLLIEDEKKIARFVMTGLTAEGYAVTHVTSIEDGLAHATRTSYQVIVLDLTLGDGDGIELCRHLRQQGRDTPILMLTARDAVSDRVKGLDAGADDYLTKPFSFEELLARLRALIRRTAPPSVDCLVVGDLKVDPVAHLVSRGTHNIALSATEWRLLLFLVEHTHQVVPKSLILKQVWGYDFSPDTNIVEVYIKYLREKIDKGHDHALIHTVHGIGYRLCVADSDT